MQQETFCDNDFNEKSYIYIFSKRYLKSKCLSHRTEQILNNNNNATIAVLSYRVISGEIKISKFTRGKKNYLKFLKTDIILKYIR